ncbi:MAG: glucuronyl esterase domain-containing protein [Limisphaerales bacterium]
MKPLVPAVGLGLLLGILVATEAEDGLDAGHSRLAELKRMFPPSAPWDEWLTRSGELPPDFEQLPVEPGLANPLEATDGRRVRSTRQWRQRRDELIQLFQHYVYGSVPLPPGNVRAAEHTRRQEDSVRIEELVLGFGPEERARLHIELIVPEGPGPFPVFITQDNHRRWAVIAASRGYLGCVYAGADSRDDTGEWTAIWPEHDWTKLTRRAWAASRCIDYLWTRPDVDRERIALTGHSRNGKTSLIAAALDERIAAVISSSSGAGGVCPWRLFSEAQFGEGIELITRKFPDWLHPRLRFFAGRENRLPLDQHELIACIAPRACLISTALNDNVESAWAIEQTLEAARPVFRLTGRPDALQLRYREGSHPTDAGDIESYVDWLDTVFDRGGAFTPSEPVFPTHADWRRASRERLDPTDFPERSPATWPAKADGTAVTSGDDWQTERARVRNRLLWLLGDSPPLAESPAGEYGSEPAYLASMLSRGSAPSWLRKDSINFGHYLRGDFYYQTNVVGTKRQLPAFIWLHPWSVSNGYQAGYHRGESPHLTMARSGYAVFAFDQIGNGSRIDEVRRFYDRHPRWSLMGRMVADARAAVGAVRQHPHVDPEQVYLVGYGTGSLTALLASALDERVAGVIAVSGLSPFRSDTVDQRTGGIARWSHQLPLLPRLGSFVGHESRIPADLDDALALIAPRTALVITPGVDLASNFENLHAAVDRARRVYQLLGVESRLVFQRSTDYDHFVPDLIWCLCGVETVR